MSDRKYRQSGYQDDNRDGEPSAGRASRGPRTPQEGPRGRGLGAPTRSVSRCARCGAQVASVASPDETCRRCGSDLHSCTNCRYFDTSAPKECRQPIEVRIAAKAKRNECGFYEPKLVQEFAADSPAGGSKSDAKAAFDDLFDF